MPVQLHTSILTVFKDLYTPFLQTSLIRRAHEKGIVDCDVDTFFSFVQPKERIDAPTFGHSAGLLIRPDVVQRAIEAKEQAVGKKAYKIFFSPQGKKLTQPLLADIARNAHKAGHMMLLPARYEGMDARVEQEHADMIVSVGDFVLMGGDVPAMMLLEGMLRLIPGVVGKQESVTHDSFTGAFVDYPEYTKPVVWQGVEVPEIVRSGHREAIRQWRMDKAARKTVRHHFSWLRSQKMSHEEKKAAHTHIPPHYVALLHGDVLIGPERTEGTTSVTSIDIHDIARSSKSYGINGFFVVNPLKDQQKIVNRILEFWHTTHGFEYNRNRYDAMQAVQVQPNIDAVIEEIEKREGKKPLLVATSAKLSGSAPLVSFSDQSTVWQEDRPVLLIFGTGQGLSDALIDRCDFLLLPVHGFSNYNHLSVRSAAAIVMDRWLGISEARAD